MQNSKFDKSRLLSTKGLTAAAGKPSIAVELDASKLVSTKGLTVAALKPA